MTTKNLPQKQDHHAGRYLGSSVVSIAFLEVIPIVLVTYDPQKGDFTAPTNIPAVSCISCKHHLQKLSLEQSFQSNFPSELPLPPPSSTDVGQQPKKLQFEWAEIHTDEAINHSYGHTTSLCRGHLTEITASSNEPLRASLLHSSSVSSSSLSPQPSFPIFYLPSDNPTEWKPQPCCIVAYANHPNSFKQQKQLQKNEMIFNKSNAALTDSCLVRILPPSVAVTAVKTTDTDMGERKNMQEDDTFSKNIPKSTLQEIQQHTLLLSGGLSEEFGQDRLSSELINEVFRNHNSETTQQLTFLISRRLQLNTKNRETMTRIGTTRDAFDIYKRNRSQRLKLKQSIRLFCKSNNILMNSKPSVATNSDNTPIQTTTATNNINYSRNHAFEPQDLPFLLVHSPNHAEGKTLLVQAIAQKLGCTRIHVIRPGYMLAKYGSYTDVALESHLHSITISAAVNAAPICIILDQMDAILSPRLSGRSNKGDSFDPIATAITSYLTRLSVSLQQNYEFPFPLKNPLYNIKGRYGQVLPVKLCMVGIITCPDDGWRSGIGEDNYDAAVGANEGHGIFDFLLAERYRLPTITGPTRLAAFSGAFAAAGVHLDIPAKKKLVGLAHASYSMHGSAFARVANLLRQHMDSKRRSKDDDNKNNMTIGPSILEETIEKVKSESAPFTAKTSFEAHTEMVLSEDDEDGELDLFDAVGGAVEAKIALIDALAMDKKKRDMLARFGMSAPAGVLLYGPPGCGKTLLAKTVAKVLKRSSGANNNSVTTGGAFLSISSSDIVSSEIGTSEKLLLSSFEFAQKNAPAVIFFDEFQALFTERSRGGSGKLASTLLQCMDDLRRWCNLETPDSEHGSQMQRIVVLGATNTPWMVDSAFLRPGRFDRVVHVSLPNEAERESILMVHFQRMQIQDRGVEDTLASLAKLIANMTVGFSGADIAALCRAAAIRALLDRNNTQDITKDHFLGALEEDVSPSSDQNLIERLKSWKP